MLEHDIVAAFAVASPRWLTQTTRRMNRNGLFGQNNPTKRDTWWKNKNRRNICANTAHPRYPLFHILVPRISGRPRISHNLDVLLSLSKPLPRVAQLHSTILTERLQPGLLVRIDTTRVTPSCPQPLVPGRPPFLGIPPYKEWTGFPENLQRRARVQGGNRAAVALV